MEDHPNLRRPDEREERYALEKRIEAYREVTMIMVDAMVDLGASRPALVASLQALIDQGHGHPATFSELSAVLRKVRR